MTPIAYKNLIRIQNAEKLLLGSEMSVEEISGKLGFNSPSYFRRTFKKYVGKTPREYRNNIDLNLKL